MTTADGFVQHLSDELDLPPLSKGEGECYWLAVGPSLEIGIGELVDGVFFTAQVGRLVPGQSKEEQCAFLLLANLFGQGTGLATIGLDDSAERVLFNLLLPQSMSNREYTHHFETYLNDAEYWMKKVASWR